MISSEMSFSSNILISVSEAVTIDDKYNNFNLSDNDINCNTVVKSQNQVIVFYSSSSLFHNWQLSCNRTSIEEEVLTTFKAHSYINEEKKYNADSSLFILNLKLNSMTDDNKTKNNNLLIASRFKLSSVSVFTDYIISISLLITLRDVEKIVYSLFTDCSFNKNYLLLLFYVFNSSHISYILFKCAQSAQK